MNENIKPNTQISFDINEDLTLIQDEEKIVIFVNHLFHLTWNLTPIEAYRLAKKLKKFANAAQTYIDEYGEDLDET